MPQLVGLTHGSEIHGVRRRSNKFLGSGSYFRSSCYPVEKVPTNAAMAVQVLEDSCTGRLRVLLLDLYQLVFVYVGIYYRLSSNSFDLSDPILTHHLIDSWQFDCMSCADSLTLSCKIVCTQQLATKLQ